MGHLEDEVVITSYETKTALYIDENGGEYEIEYDITYTKTEGYDQKHLTSVMKDGKDVDSDDPIWDEIQMEL